MRSFELPARTRSSASRAKKLPAHSGARRRCRACTSQACTRISARNCSSASRTSKRSRSCSIFTRRRAAPASTLAELIVGGGFGVDDGLSAETLDVAATLRALATRLASEARARGIPAPRLGIEPGRAIVAEAGTSLYRVLALKRRGERRFAIVDGSLADNPRSGALRLAPSALAGGPCLTCTGRVLHRRRTFVRKRRVDDGRAARRFAARRPRRPALDGRLHLQHGEQLQSLPAAGGGLRRRRKARRCRAPSASGRRFARRPGTR